MDDPRGDRLYDLLVALFHSDDELQRFLVLEGLRAPQSRSVKVVQRGRTEGAYETVQALIAENSVDESFFRALERRTPQRAPDIRAVRQLFVDDPTGSPSSVLPEAGPLGVPDEFADLAAELEADLARAAGPDDSATALDPGHWPWTGAACVFGAFNPTALTPLPAEGPPSMQAMSALVDFVTMSHSGAWVLRKDVRHSCLRRLAEEGLLGTALRLNEDLDDVRRDLMAELVGGQHQQLTLMDRSRLVDLDAVLEWLEPLGIPLPVDRVQVQTAAERRALIDPLRSLVGTHFRGRVEELDRLHAHVGSTGRADPLFVLGVGGVGKSTLVGKVLLELEERAPFDPLSFVYVDFDKARNDPHDRNNLLRELSQQLRLLYVNADVAQRFAAVESSYWGTDLARAAELLDVTDAPDDHAILDILCRSLAELHRGEEAPLVLVLDTCEEVLAKGPGAVHNVVRLLLDFQERLPGVRIVLSGRAALPWPDTLPSAATLRLGDLDGPAADALLSHLGVESPTLRSLIVRQYGANPLTLRLAAEALARAGSAEAAFSEVTPTRVMSEVAMEQIQGMLYTRVLRHIRDAEVASVAHPGLAVRRVTVEVLHDVLAVPCGFHPDRASAIFDKLRSELSLFDLEGDHILVHRPDVRRLMLRTMAEDPDRAARVADIHSRAGDYYSRQTGPEARTELVYHRLMSDTDPRTLEPLWDEDVRRGLESAREEPFPPRARRWLERRLSSVPVEEDRSEWEQEDWEAEAYSRISSWLASSAPARALEVLTERTSRLPGSRLLPLEVAVRLSLDDIPGAMTALHQAQAQGIEQAPRQVQLELAEQELTIRARTDDVAGLVEAVETCVGLSDLVGEPSRALRAMTSALRELQRLGAQDEVTLVRDQLAARFARLTREEMRAQPELVRDILLTAGLGDSSILVHAAVNVGDQTNDVGGVFLEDAFAVGRVLRATNDVARPVLDLLAAEVGLVAKWSIDELASRLVRTGRTGKAVAVGLDYAQDDGQTRAVVVDQLVQQAAPSTIRGMS